jgi:hypothetical protein
MGKGTGTVANKINILPWLRLSLMTSRLGVALVAEHMHAADTSTLPTNGQANDQQDCLQFWFSPPATNESAQLPHQRVAQLLPDHLIKRSANQRV